MRCIHLNPPGHPEINTERKMCALAEKEHRFDICWGVVNGGNALVHSVHRTKREAEKERKAHACAYSVVKVAITLLYEQNYPEEN